MPTLRYDVLGIGNAIVDVLARADDDFLVKQDMAKGGMALIDQPRAEAIYDAMGPAVEISGGSAANTIVGVASLGARGAFVGKVKDDEFGRTFAHDIRAAGVAFDTPPASDGPSTARCYILVTPDGERTMNTFLGAAQDLHPNDIDPDAIAAARDHLSRRLSVGSAARQGGLPQGGEDRAWRRAPRRAHAVGRVLRRSLSRRVPRPHPQRHRRYRVRQRARAAQPLPDRRLRHRRQRAAQRRASSRSITRSEKGCLVVTREQTDAVRAAPIDKMVDATGAGDLFAAGFLVGLARGADHRNCARLGALAAAEVIQHMGARPETSLKALAEAAGFSL